MLRVEEMLAFIDRSSADASLKARLKQEAVDLERERQYEERVMAGRLNLMATNLLVAALIASVSLG